MAELTGGVSAWTRTLELIGSYLTAGLAYSEIAARLECSEDWVANAVHRLRSALAVNALENGSDELPLELRARLETFVIRP